MLMSEIVVEQPFGVYEGKAVSAYRLSNANGLVARLTNFGARLIAMMVPDRDGISADVVLGFDDLAAYAESNSYFGATCGRYGNQIKRGRFVLGGRRSTSAETMGPTIFMAASRASTDRYGMARSTRPKIRSASRWYRRMAMKGSLAGLSPGRSTASPMTTD